MKASPLSAEVATSKVLDGFSFCNVTGSRVAIMFDVAFVGDEVELRLASPGVPANPDDDDTLVSASAAVIDHWRLIVQRLRELAERQVEGPQAWESTLNSMGLG